MDRAFHLGDFGRTDQNQKTRQGKEAFKKVFEHCIEDAEEVEPAKETPREALEDLSVEDKRDAERKSKSGGEREAEKRAGWRGPNPLLGLAFNPTLLKPTAPPVGEAEQTGSQRKSTASERASDPASAPVDVAIIQHLRQVGLEHPINGFHDPRVREEYALLDAQWRETSIPGGKSYEWRNGTAFQKLRISDGTGLIESSAGGVRQVIEKSQGEYRASLHTEGSDFPA